MSASEKNNARKNPGKGQRKSQLPLILVGGGILLLVLAAVYVFSSRQPTEAEVPLDVSGAPALRVDKEKVDFGDVKVDTPVSATFEIANAGDQPLLFSKPPAVEVVEGC